MMPCNYISKSGTVTSFDLDSVFDFVGGYSTLRPGWSALVILVPVTKAFVELRSSPQDYKGNSADEAEEIDEIYIKDTYNMTSQQLMAFKANPKNWQFIDQRKT